MTTGSLARTREVSLWLKPFGQGVSAGWAKSLIVAVSCLLPSTSLLAQEVRQALNMAYPAEGTFARLHVDLFGNRLGGWPTVVGDVNADGYDDFVWVRWSHAKDTLPDSLLVFGGPHLVGVTETAITGVPHFRIHHRTSLDGLLPRCRRAVGPAGDIDGDGYADFIITACSFGAGGFDSAGRAILVFGQEEFPEEAQLADLSAAGVRALDIVSEEEGRRLGMSVNRIGDIDGDGLADLALGAQGAPTLGGEEQAGWLYVLFGGFSAREAIDVSDVGTEVRGFVLRGASGERHHLLGDGLGADYVEGGGDVNGDGIADLLVPAIGVNRAAGAVYVVYGRREFETGLDAADPGSFGVEIRGVRENARFGRSLSGVGDVDGDGLADFIVGEPGGTLNVPQRAYLIYGSESWPERIAVGDPGLRALEIVPTDPPSKGLFGTSPRLFGWWVEGIGDWNEDGFADFAVGAAWQAVERDKMVGRTYIVYGGQDLPSTALDTDVGTSTLPGIVLEGHRPVSGFGIAGDVGDIDGDQRQDLLVVGATSSELGEDESPSSVTILFREVFDATTFAVETIDPPQAGWLVGGDRVRIRGRGFQAGVSVFFGDVEAPQVRVINSALIEAVTPPMGRDGLVDVEVRQGNQRARLAGAFRYRRRLLRNLMLDREALSDAGMRSTDVSGLGVRAAGSDLNNDGRSDLVLSDPSFEAPSLPSLMHIVFGRESWPSGLEEADVTICNGPVVGFSVDFDVDTDLDGDGFEDLVVGGVDRTASPFQAPGWTYLLRGYGEVWPAEIDIRDEMIDGRAVSFSSLPCGKTNPKVVALPGGDLRIAIGQAQCVGPKSVVSLYAAQAFEGPPELVGGVQGDLNRRPGLQGSLGESLAAVGDMNGDGWPDLAAGDSFNELVFILLGDSDLFESGPTVGILDLVAQGRAVRLADQNGTMFGRRIEPAGDFNGDGLPDVVISAEHGGGEGSLRGRAYIVFGTSRFGTSLQEIDVSQEGPTHVTITGEDFRDTAGYGHGVGDIDADGYSDIVITGSYRESETHKAHVVLGAPDPPASIDLALLRERGFEVVAPDGLEIVGALGQQESNQSVVGADFDGDGAQDLAFPYRLETREGMFVIFGPIVRSGFVRGNANGDERVDISDAVAILDFLFLGDEDLPCLDAADTDDSGSLDLSDAVRLLNHLFLGAKPLPPPFPERGQDPTEDDLGCF